MSKAKKAIDEAADQAAESSAAAVEAVGSLLDPEHVELRVGDDDYEVTAMSGHEKVSGLFRFDLDCDARASDPSPQQLIGRRCEMTLRDGFGAEVSIQGFVAEASRMVRDEGSAEVRLVMRPNAYPLTLSRDSRVFNDMTVPEIVERVLDKLPVEAPRRWELGRSYRRRVYTAQYREADWTFISRLLEEEGIYYWFDHEAADTVLVFADDSTDAAKLTGDRPIEFALDTGMIGDKELIHELAAEAHATATKFTVGSFNPWNPSLKVTASEGDGLHEMYDAPGGGPEDPEVCRRLARNRLEHAQSHRASVSGNASSVRIDPGRILDMVGHPHHDGSYFVTEVSYQVRQRRRFSGEGGGYECHFEAVPAQVTFRPPEDTPVAKQAGFQSGRVVGPPGEEIHTDDRGRVRVQLHWDREGAWDDRAGRWMRVAQRGVSMSMLYPRTGWNVMTFMDEGDVSAPNVLSRVHDAEHPPTYSLPDNKTRTVYRTQTSPGGGSANEIRYEDLLGIQEMFLNASKDMNYQVRNNYGHNVGNDNVKRVGADQKMQIGNIVQADVQNDQTMRIGGKEALEVKEDRDKNVGGNETCEVTGDRKLEVGSNITHAVEKDRKLEVTGDVIEEAREGLIKAGCTNALVTISGSVTQTIQGIHNEDVGKGCEKLVSESKIETCKNDYTVEVNDTLTETIGDNLKMTAGKHFMDGSDKKTLWQVGAQMQGKAKQRVQIQAKNRIVLRVGGSMVELDKDSITITAASYSVSDSSDTVAKAPKITQNPS